MHSPEPASPPGEHSEPDELHIAARHIEPGDHLPPQPVLHGTRYQHDGFTVGEEDRDVLAGLAVLPGRMLLYGPAGTLDSVALDARVAVRRRPRRPGQDSRDAV